MRRCNRLLNDPSVKEESAEMRARWTHFVWYVKLLDEAEISEHGYAGFDSSNVVQCVLVEIERE